MGIRRRIESRVNSTLAQAQGAVAHSNRMMSKAEGLIDEALELLAQLEEAGLEIDLEIAGKALPCKLRLRPAPDADQTQTTPP